ncbi:transposase [Desulfurivibrio dismutans]|uniref:transposase n=1 Tax=Desulfurivibrio dismutans TaxID=1398908 RepID=UPI0023D9B215|nr:transposase [Desulfurivibrio alkaliphilus]MDF1615231.1 transposase [Desulfurivibrio alkaliphilus]
MARPLRIEYEGAWYHVMNRGRGRCVTFPADAAYRAFLDTMDEAVERFQLEVHAYCLMPNHYHLLVRTPLGNLSRIMRHIDGLYTQRHNRLVNTDGSLFRGRYKAILAEADAYLLALSRYIHRNPVAGEAPLVMALGDWPWSSYPVYTGHCEPPPWLVLDDIRNCIGSHDFPARYQAFVESGEEDVVDIFHARERQEPILGREAFRERVLGGGRRVPEVPRRQTRPLQQPEALLRAVAAWFDLEVEHILARGNTGAAEARPFAMWLCQQEAGLTLREIGVLFGNIHYSAVSQNIRRLKRRWVKERLCWHQQAVMSRLDP